MLPREGREGAASLDMHRVSNRDAKDGARVHAAMTRSKVESIRERDRERERE